MLDSGFDKEFSSFSRRVREKSMFDSDFDQEFKSCLAGEPVLRHRSPLGGRQANSTYKATNYSSVTSSSSRDGGVPHRESHTDTTHRTVRTGVSGIPHTTYHHSTHHTDSARPYTNTLTTHSYNI